MERILVSIGTEYNSWEAWNRAILLAKRLGPETKLFALLVLPDVDGFNAVSDKDARMIRERFKLQVELAKSENENIHIDCFITEGSFEEEVIRFAQNNRITLLVLESAEGCKRHNSAKGNLPSLRTIIHKIPCRVELVTPLKYKQKGKGEGIKNGISTASLPANSRKQR